MYCVSAGESYLHDLFDTIHNYCLKKGAFKSFYVEAFRPSLHISRCKLSLQYSTKVAANLNNQSLYMILNMPSKVYFKSISTQKKYHL